MRLYRVLYFDGTFNGNRATWAGTQSDAKALQKRLEAEHGRHNVDAFEQVDVPTEKATLLVFLNQHATLPDPSGT